MATVSMPLQYKRLYSGPLDCDSTFDTLEEAAIYVSSPSSYNNQIIGVGGKAYIIMDKKITPLTLNENVKIITDLPQVGVYGIIYLMSGTTNGYMWFANDWVKVISRIISNIQNLYDDNGDILSAAKDYAVDGNIIADINNRVIKLEKSGGGGDGQSTGGTIYWETDL